MEGDERRQEASKKVQEALREVGEGIQEASEGVASSLAEALHSLGDRIKEVSGMEAGADSGYTADVGAESEAKRAAEGVKERTGRAADSARGEVEGVGKESEEKARSVLENVRGRLQQAGEEVKEKVEESVEGVRTRVGGSVEESTEKVRQGVSERVGGTAEGAKVKLEESVEAAKKRVGEGMEKVQESLGNTHPNESRGTVSEFAQSLLLSSLKKSGAILAMATLLLSPPFSGPSAASPNPLQNPQEAAGNVLERFVGPRYEDSSDAREAGSKHLFGAQDGLEKVKGQGAKALGTVQEKGREAAGAVKDAVQSPVRATQGSLDSGKDQGSRVVEGVTEKGADALGKVGEAGRKNVLEPLQRSADVPRSIADEIAEQAKFTGTPRKGSPGGEGPGDGSYVQGNAIKGALDLLTGKGRETVEKVTPGGGKEAYPVDKDASAVVLSGTPGPYVTVSLGESAGVTVALDVGETKDPIVTDVGNAIDATKRSVVEARGMFGGAKNKVEDAVSGVRGKAEEAKGAVEGQLEGAGESVKDTSKGINETVQEGINKAGNILKGVPEDALAGPKRALEEVTKNLPNLEYGKGADRSLSEEERDFQSKGSGAEKGAFMDGTELGKQMEGYMEK